MTLNDFLNKLELYAHDKITWYYMGKDSKYIIGLDDRGREFCPVTWVCYKHEKKFINRFIMENAGRKLELSRDNIWNLSLAADFNENDYRNKLGTKAIFDIGLRIKLETILSPKRDK
jgi:hypothetical protein